MPELMIAKVCTKCSLEKSVADFSRNKNKKDGLQGVCKSCERAYNAAYRAANPEKAKAASSAWVEANRERVRARQAAYYQANAARISARDAAEHAANPDKENARSAAKYAADPSKAKGYSAAWAKANPEARRAHTRNRRAIKRNAEGIHTAADVRTLLTLQKCKCVVCKANIKYSYHVDHIQPLSRGGGNGKHDIQLLCPSCNLQKHAKHPIDFMQSKGFLI